MITFGEWHKFNFVDNKIMDHIGDMYIKVFRNHSFKTEDKCMECLIKIDDAVKMFDKYILMKVNHHSAPSAKYGGEYKALCELIYLEEESHDTTGSN